MSDQKTDKTVDLSAGVSESSIADHSSLAGRSGDDDVLLVRSGNRFFAVGAHCTHYRGPLADGIVVGANIRCPLHHACFSLETGEALRAPALDPINCWRVEQRDGKRNDARYQDQPRQPDATLRTHLCHKLLHCEAPQRWFSGIENVICNLRFILYHNREP